jgi:hypothetical protein
VPFQFQVVISVGPVAKVQRSDDPIARALRRPKKHGEPAQDALVILHALQDYVNPAM